LDDVNFGSLRTTSLGQAVRPCGSSSEQTTDADCSHCLWILVLRQFSSSWRRGEQARKKTIPTFLYSVDKNGNVEIRIKEDDTRAAQGFLVLRKTGELEKIPEGVESSSSSTSCKSIPATIKLDTERSRDVPAERQDADTEEESSSSRSLPEDTLDRCGVDSKELSPPETPSAPAEDDNKTANDKGESEDSSTTLRMVEDEDDLAIPDMSSSNASQQNSCLDAAQTAQEEEVALGLVANVPANELHDPARAAFSALRTMILVAFWIAQLKAAAYITTK